MANIGSLPNNLDRQRASCRAIIETPKGRHSKFAYDPETNLFELGGVLPEGMIFPLDFGFIPSTLGEDGDPLDIMVLMDEPAHVGCLVKVRVVGVIEADQTEDGSTNENARLLAVASQSRRYEDIGTIDHISENLLRETEQFFVSYNKLHGKKFEVTGRGGPERALEMIERGIEAFTAKKE